MNETPRKKEKDKELRELCSLITARLPLMIIGGEDASAAVSEKCNLLFFLYSFFIHEVALIAAHISPALSPSIKS